MTKFIDRVCLLIWIGCFIYGVYTASIGGMCDPFTFICSTAVCIIHYIDNLSR